MNELYLQDGAGLRIKRGDVVFEIQAGSDQIDIYTVGMRVEERQSGVGFVQGSARHLVVTKVR